MKNDADTTGPLQVELVRVRLLSTSQFAAKVGVGLRAFQKAARARKITPDFFVQVGVNPQLLWRAERAEAVKELLALDESSAVPSNETANH